MTNTEEMTNTERNSECLEFSECSEFLCFCVRTLILCLRF